MAEIFENIPQPEVQETPEIHELVDISCCDTSFIQKTPLNLLHKRVLDSLNVDNSNNKKCNIEKDKIKECELERNNSERTRYCK